MLITELKKSKYNKKSIADFGCGEGSLQIQLQRSDHKGKIYSFDAGKFADHII